MYSNYALLHQGKAHLPEGVVQIGSDALLDCGHSRPADGTAALGWSGTRPSI